MCILQIYVNVSGSSEDNASFTTIKAESVKSVYFVFENFSQNSI